MSFSIPELVLLTVAALLFAALVFLVSRLMSLSRQQADLAVRVTDLLEAKHLAMLKDVNDGLNSLGDRLATAEADNVERLRGAVETQLRQTREAMVTIQLSQSQDMATNREQLLERVAEVRTDMLGKTLAALAEQGKVQAETLQDSVRSLSQQLTASIEALTRAVDGRLEQIQGKVAERLEEGFRKTNETFVSVMERLATIDEAQRKIDGLTTNVVSLQELLGDKRSRGAYGEIQLEALVRNILPPSAYVFQAKVGDEQRVADCLLQLPEPTGIVAVDAKFPMENYHRMFEPGLTDNERAAARRQFRADLRKHVDDIANRYIIPGETSEGAVMFIPAEAVFAEIHAYHAEVVDHAMQRHVWIVSPTTMMAVLNTARAVIKDVETRRQVHVIKDELGKLGKDFGRFEERMRKLANHIRQAHQDAEEVRISSDKIVRRFGQIEKVELDAPGDVARLEQEIDEADAGLEVEEDAAPRAAERAGV